MGFIHVDISFSDNCDRLTFLLIDELDRLTGDHDVVVVLVLDTFLYMRTYDIIVEAKASKLESLFSMY